MATTKFDNKTSPLVVESNKQQQNTIITTLNGIKIESKLNPCAKEFYPSYLRIEKTKQQEHCKYLASHFDGGDILNSSEKQQNKEVNLVEIKQQNKEEDLAEIKQILDKVLESEKVEFKADEDDKEIKIKPNIKHEQKTETVKKDVLKKISNVSNSPHTTTIAALPKNCVRRKNCTITNAKSNAVANKIEKSQNLNTNLNSEETQPTLRLKRLTKLTNISAGQTAARTKPSPVKDFVMLRSSSSTEKSTTSRSSASSCNKTLSSECSIKSNTKSKDCRNTNIASKLPRSTLASSLRLTETQKRRNLFPNDDSETSIELKQFLFK